jgi:hypothetical protein
LNFNQHQLTYQAEEQGYPAHRQALDVSGKPTEPFFIMKEMKTIFFVTMFISLTSCDPVHTLAVYNTSGRERQIEVIGILRDSIPVQQLDADGKLEKARMTAVGSKDERKSGFMFTLPPAQQANLEFGFGTKPLTDRIIIDRTDTVRVKRSLGRVKKKPFYAIGGNYVLTIRD